MAESDAMRPLITPEQCKAARQLLGWSQDELVERSGVSKGTIVNFEKGARSPYNRTLEDIVDAFGEAGAVVFWIDREANPKATLMGALDALRATAKSVGVSISDVYAMSGTPEWFILLLGDIPFESPAKN